VSPLEITVIIFFCMFGGAMFGIWLRGVLPKEHLDAETKDLVKLGMGLIGTMTALLLGLLIASAKSSFDAHNNELTQMAANIIVLDRTLTHYGPETREIRGVLRQAVIRTIGQIWPKDSEAGGGLGPGGLGTQTGGEVIYDKIQELGPRTEAQRAIQSQAESLMINLAQTRWLLFAQSARAISTPFLIVVVFWLSMLFVSFGLFAPLNATAIATLLVIAISSAGAFFLILELDRPFSGLIHISSAPLYNALALLGR